MTSVAMPNTIAVCHGSLAAASAQATISALSVAQAPAQLPQNFGDRDHPRNVASIRAHGWLCPQTLCCIAATDQFAHCFQRSFQRGRHSANLTSPLDYFNVLVLVFGGQY